MLSRRQLLQRAGAATAALTLPLPAAVRAAAAAPALSLHRQATHAALIETFALLPASPVDAAQAPAEAARLATRYSAGTPSLRGDVDDALDAVQGRLAPDGFARMSPQQRLAHVRDALRDDRDPRRLAGAFRASGFALAPFVAGDPRLDWTSLGLIQGLMR